MNKQKVANLLVKYFKLFLLAVVLVIPVSYLVCRIGKVSSDFGHFASTYIYWIDYKGVLHIDDDIFQFLLIQFIVIILIDFLRQLIKWTIENKS
jgi:hypothetical protein